MQNWGCHMVTEVYGCPSEILGDVKQIENAMVHAAGKAGANICSAVYQQYKQQGVSGAFVTPEAHVALHTWVDLNCAVIDVFSCSNEADLLPVCRSLAEELGGEGYNISMHRKDQTLPVGGTAVSH